MTWHAPMFCWIPLPACHALILICDVQGEVSSDRPRLFLLSERMEFGSIAAEVIGHMDSILWRDWALSGRCGVAMKM